MTHPSVVAQDPDDKSFYDVDFCNWLSARGFPIDGSTIDSITFVVAAPATKTFETKVGAVGRVGVSGVSLNTNVLITATIVMPEVFSGGGTIEADFSFTLRGTPG